MFITVSAVTVRVISFHTATTKPSLYWNIIWYLWTASCKYQWLLMSAAFKHFFRCHIYILSSGHLIFEFSMPSWLCRFVDWIWIKTCFCVFKYMYARQFYRLSTVKFSLIQPIYARESPFALGPVLEKESKTLCFQLTWMWSIDQSNQINQSVNPLIFSF